MRKHYLLSFALILTGIQLLQAQVWEPVGTSESVSEGPASYCHLELDNKNNYFLNYYDAEIERGTVKKFDGSSWSYLGGSSQIGENTDFLTTLATDNNDIPYFVSRLTDYSDYPFVVTLKTSKLVNGQWSSLPDLLSYPNNITSGFSSSNEFILVSNDSTGIAYKYNGNKWDTIGKPGFSTVEDMRFVDMVIDSKDNIYISYVANDSVYIVSNTVNADINQLWTPVGVNGALAPAKETEQYNSNIVIDVSDNIYIQYTTLDENGGNVTVQKYNGVSWSYVGAENFTPTKAQHASLTVSKDGVPYIAVSDFDNYENTPNYVMKYDNSTSSWSKVGSEYISVGSATYNSIIVDTNNVIILSFIDETMDRLVAKKLSPKVIMPDSVDVFIPASLDPVISVDNATLQVSATVYPLDADQSIKWSVISGTERATISEAGLVTAFGNDGAVTVRAASENTPTIFGTIRIELTNQISNFTPEYITITTENNVRADILKLGETLKLNATVFPAEADQNVNWSIISGNEVASIDTSGVITAKTQGYCTVRASINEVTTDLLVSVYENGITVGTLFGDIMNGLNVTKDIGIKSADDVLIGKDTLLETHKIVFTLIAFDSIAVSSANINFLSTIDSAPGEVIKSYVSLMPVSQSLIDVDDHFYKYLVEIILPEPLNLTTGQCWIQPEFEIESNNSVYWNFSPEQKVGAPMHINKSKGWALASGSWDAEFYLVGNLKVIEHDVKINAVNLEVPRTIPVKHLYAIKSIPVEIENNAKNADEAILTVKYGDITLGNQNVSLSSLEVKQIDLPVDFSNIVAGDLIDLSFNLSLDSDQNLINNINAKRLSVSDSTFIADYVDDTTSNSIGSSSAAISLGSAFSLIVPDTLTSINVRFTENSALVDEEFVIAVYKFNEDNTFETTPLIEELFTRGIGGPSVNYKLTPTPIPVGTYVFCVEQTVPVNIEITSDITANGLVYEKRENDYFVAHIGYGALHIRPNFNPIKDSIIEYVALDAINEANLYPNPVQGQLIIESRIVVEQLTIYSIQGQEIYVSSDSFNKKVVNTEDFIPGIYYAKVRTEHGESTKKFIVE